MVTSPALSISRKWWDPVAGASPNHSHTHEQVGACFDPAILCSISNRFGSASALLISANRSSSSFFSRALISPKIVPPVDPVAYPQIQAASAGVRRLGPASRLAFGDLAPKPRSLPRNAAHVNLSEHFAAKSL